MKLYFVLVLLAGLPVLAGAQDSEGVRLAAERRAVVERFAAEERACAQRFAVTACVDETRARRRQALAPLREREVRMDEADRRQRAAERRAAIATKVAAAASGPAGPAAPAPDAPAVRVRAPATAPSAALRAARPSQDDAARASQADKRVREAQVRQQGSLAAQQRIQRRLADRLARGQQAEPLPVPEKARAKEPAKAPQPASSPRR